MSKLVLASGSRYRSELLGRLGVSFEILPADIDETASDGESPQDLALRLAREKALEVQKRRPGMFVIGSDQVIFREGRVYQKPGGRERAIEQLMSLQGGEHLLATATVLLSPTGSVREDLCQYEMEMRRLNRLEVAAYVDEEEPFDCAGSYRIEAGGIRLFRSMRGEDFTAIVGLPLTRVQRMLEEAGYFGKG